jgi:Ca2+-binding RTX toxin-like protein
MLITAQPRTPIRLPLETAFTIDFAALLPEGAVLQGVGLESDFGGRQQALDRLGEQEGTVVSFMPREDWTGLALDPMDPLASVGRLVLYIDIDEPIFIELLPSLPAVDEKPILKGTAGQDTLVHDAGDPQGSTTALIDTSGGSDRAGVVNGAAILLGRSGDDTMTGWNLDDALYGGGGRDILFGGAGNDRLLGLTGDDRLFGGMGRDLLAGGVGNDLLTGGADEDTLSAGPGNDTLRGEAGDDLILVAQRTGDPDTRPANMVLAYGGDGNDIFDVLRPIQERGDSRSAPVAEDGGMVDLYGGLGADDIYMYEIAGGSLYGGEGDDNISGGVARDVTGSVALFGGAGNDNLYGGLGSDIYGGTGDDIVNLMEGGKATTGDGNDTVYIVTNYLADSTSGTGGEVYGGGGSDTVTGNQRGDTIHGGDGDDSLSGWAGNDRLFGGVGVDTLWGGAGNDWLSGGDGDDQLYASDDNSYTDEDIANGLVGLGDTLFGGAGDDQLWTDRVGHTLYGGSGNDSLVASQANTYATDPSVLDGGLGDDTLQGAGSSSATGGDGSDTFLLDMGSSIGPHVMNVGDFVRGEDKLEFSSGGGGAQGITTFYQGTLDNVDPIPGLTVAWESEGTNRVRAEVDWNGDGVSDGTFIVTGVGDLMLSDFAGFFPT